MDPPTPPTNTIDRDGQKSPPTEDQQGKKSADGGQGGNGQCDQNGNLGDEVALGLRILFDASPPGPTQGGIR